MKRHTVFMLASVLLAATACAPAARSTNAPVPTQPSSAAVANVTPARVAVPTVEPTSNPTRQSSASQSTTSSSPPPTLPDPAATNSAQALENVAKITYAALADKQDLKPYITGVMTAFGVPPLGEGDVTLAGTRYKQGLPLMFLPQVAEMADAFNDGGFVSLDSFIAAANNQGAKQQGTNNPLTRDYLTLKFAAYVSKANYEPKQVLPAFVLALGKERVKRFPPQKPDPLWGDGLLDPLQLTLLLYSVSYADAGPLPTTVPMASVPQASGVVYPYMAGSLVIGPIQASLIASVAGADPIGAFIKDQIQGQVEGEVQDMIGVPLDKYDAAQVSVCGSLLLYGHKLKVTTTPKLIYHKDGTKPWSTRVDATLSFQDDYWDNYLPVDRWMLENLGNCKLPRRGTVEGKPLEWSVSDGLREHGNYNITPAQTDGNGRASANWQTVPETTPESQRTFFNQRDAVGAAIVRAGSLVPGWSGLERVVGALRDTGNTGDSPITVIYYKVPQYRVDGVYWGAYHLTGTVCALDKTFTLKAEQSLGGQPGVGEFVFTPAGGSSGNWKYAGTMCGEGICFAVNGSGTFQLDGIRDGKPAIRMNPGNWTATAPPPLGETYPLGPGGQHLGIVETIKLEPTTEGCPTK